jgi:hypothetical protein
VCEMAEPPESQALLYVTPPPCGASLRPGEITMGSVTQSEHSLRIERG